ncbi:type II secretion system F family protein [Synechococcus sp. HK05]|uniref:type II secretion system F family protein n=1 Tax=Synechococcus sp. HK05 TaxID=2725975 RepID=UPI001C389C0E|nr:type II secretion system F family protein [Synechococcus sp. HK05]MBV2352211.1 type II secretion system F family protein [Synechococcus sp. HK05]
MPSFSATYTTRAGQTRQLRLTAADAASARRDLRRRGIVPSALELVEGTSSRGRGGAATAAAPRGTAGHGTPAVSSTPATTVFGLDLSGLLEARPGIREKALFANKLAALVDAGVPIVRSLDLMARQQRMPLFKRALTAVSTDVNQGGSLGAALRRWPKVFDKLTIAMVEAGEAGGVLDESLRRLAKLLEGNAKLQNQIKGAMGYPVAVLVIAVLVFLGMTIFLIPTFAGIFEDLGAELPLFTQLMVDLSKLLRSSFSLLLVLVLTVAAWLFSRYYATADGRRRVDGLLLQLPLFGDLIQKTATAKFCRTFSSLTRAGVPILLSLEIVQETAGNAVIADAIVASRQDVQEGIPLSVALGRKQVFPELALSMLAIGEETGQMDTMLSKVADFYEDEVEAAVKALTSMLEPAMIVIVGGIVGSILLAMYLPMFSIFDQIK